MLRAKELSHELLWHISPHPKVQPPRRVNEINSFLLELLRGWPHSGGEVYAEEGIQWRRGPTTTTTTTRPRQIQPRCRGRHWGQDTHLGGKSIDPINTVIYGGDKGVVGCGTEDSKVNRPLVTSYGHIRIWRPP